MSKVLIDRALLERAVYRLELAYDADAPIVCDLSSVLSAPSGTPEMPVKAYYHEAPNEYGGLNKSVGLEVRKEFTDAPLVLEADALARIACLEGEIAKRDEVIVGLTNSRDFWREKAIAADDELAAIKAQEPIGWYTEDHLDDKSATTYSWTVAERWVEKGWPVSPLYAAPVSEAKAQGVVMPDTEDFCFCGKHVSLQMISGGASNHGYLGSVTLLIDGEYVEYTRLNAAPVQQASVPDGWRVERGYSPSGYVLHSPSGGMVRVCDSGGGGIETAFALFLKAMLAAAPAAPAADAGLVEALELAANRLDRLALEQGEFWRGYATEWADEARATAKGVKS